MLDRRSAAVAERGRRIGDGVCRERVPVQVRQEQLARHGEVRVGQLLVRGSERGPDGQGGEGGATRGDGQEASRLNGPVIAPPSRSST